MSILIQVALCYCCMYRRHLLSAVTWKTNNVVIICCLLFRLLAEMSSGVVLAGTGMWEKGKCNFFREVYGC